MTANVTDKALNKFVNNMVTGTITNGAGTAGQAVPTAQHVCPNCGYCPCCGRRYDSQPNPWYSPWYPNTTPQITFTKGPVHGGYASLNTANTASYGT